MNSFLSFKISFQNHGQKKLGYLKTLCVISDQGIFFVENEDKQFF